MIVPTDQIQTVVFSVYMETPSRSQYKTQIMYIDTNDYTVTKALYYFFKSLVNTICVPNSLYYNIEVANGPSFDMFSTYAYYVFTDDFEITEDIVKACRFTAKSHVLDLPILEHTNDMSAKPFTGLLDSGSNSELNVICLDVIPKASIRRLSAKEQSVVENVQFIPSATMALGNSNITNTVNLLQIQMKPDIGLIDKSDFCRQLITEIGGVIDITRLLQQFPNVLKPVFYDSSLIPSKFVSPVNVNKPSSVKQIIDFVSSNGYEFITVTDYMFGSNWRVYYFYNSNNGKFCTLIGDLLYTNDTVLRRLCMEW